MRASLRQTALLLALALLPALISAAVQWRALGEAVSPGDEITWEATQALGGRVLWVDARTRAQYDQGHIEGAVLLNEDQWVDLMEGFLDAWEEELQVVVYCDGGGCDASRSVSRRLREEMGLENVRILKGGWKKNSP